jgi:flavin-dependent dehydrogenase
MLLGSFVFSSCFLSFCAVSHGAPNSDASVSGPSIITSDVVIIGGGSSGTYSAIRLREHGKTVTLIEREAVLGGHVNTYHDPATGITFDYGVITFDNISVVTDYFKHFDVPLGPVGDLFSPKTTF